MVESTLNYELKLNLIFSSLADETRRDIVKRVSEKEYNVSELAELYTMSLNAVSKHIKILERASLVTKIRKGKYNYIQLSPNPFKSASEYLGYYKQFWGTKLDALGEYLEKEESDDTEE